MKKPEKLPPKHVACFNDFVTAANAHGLLFESLNINIGEDYQGKVGLHFEIETSNGLTKEECQEIFGEFISKYPACGINYNIRELSELEKALHNVSTVVMEVHEGFKLETITQ